MNADLYTIEILFGEGPYQELDPLRLEQMMAETQLARERMMAEMQLKREQMQAEMQLKMLMPQEPMGGGNVQFGGAVG